MFLPTLPKKPSDLAKNTQVSNMTWNNSKESARKPIQGTELSPGIRKIRMAIESKHKGLSGGARVITYNILAQEQNGEIELLLLYDKGDADTVKLSVVKEIVRDMGFPI